MLGLKSGYSPDAARRLLQIAHGAMRAVDHLKSRTPSVWEAATGLYEGVGVDFEALDNALRDADALAKKHPAETVEYLGETMRTPELARRIREVRTTAEPLRGGLGK